MAIISFARNELQKTVVFAPYSKIAYVGAIRSGKTVGMAARRFMICDLYPAPYLIARKNYTDLYSTTAKEYFKIAAARNGGTFTKPGPYVKKWDAEFHDMYLQSGAILHFRHMTGIGHLLSLEIAGYDIDQAEEIEEDEFWHVDSRTSFWNRDRIEEFRKTHDYAPREFCFLAANPDPGFLKWLLFENPRTEKEWYTYETDIEANRQNLGPTYIEKLYETHPKDWCDRFLKGSWDVRGGQIYKEFNEAIHAIESFAIPLHWKRYLSLDWGISDYHKAVCLFHAVDEYGNIFTYREISVTGKIVSDFAKLIKLAAEDDEGIERSEDGGIYIWMDPSTDKHRLANVDRTIMQEFALHGIYGIPANNEVQAGINKVMEVLHVSPKTNKPGAFIFNQCKHLIRGLKLYQWRPVNQNGISREEPLKKDDDECLIAGTMIETSAGLKPIDQMQIGDMAQTRQGLQRVSNAWKTGIRDTFKVVFSNGAQITGTGNHPIWIENVGFVRIDALRYGMIVNHSLLGASWLRQWFTKARTIGAIQIQDIKEVANTSQEILKAIASCCIEGFGKIITGRYQKDFIYTIKTGIQGITTSTTWNVFPNPTIYLSIRALQHLKRLNILRTSDHLALHGMLHKQENNGIVNTPKEFSMPSSPKTSNVTIVEKTSNQNQSGRDSALITVSQRGEENKKWIKSWKLVKFVRKCFSEISMLIQRHAPVYVLEISSAGQREVYNLTVENEHEYYANGVLVSNCDAYRYGIMSILEDRADKPVSRRDSKLSEYDAMILEKFKAAPLEPEPEGSTDFWGES